MKNFWETNLEKLNFLISNNVSSFMVHIGFKTEEDAINQIMRLIRMKNFCISKLQK